MLLSLLCCLSLPLPVLRLLSTLPHKPLCHMPLHCCRQARKGGRTLAFYTLPEYEAWRESLSGSAAAVRLGCWGRRLRWLLRLLRCSEACATLRTLAAAAACAHTHTPQSMARAHNPVHPIAFAQLARCRAAASVLQKLCLHAQSDADPAVDASSHCTQHDTWPCTFTTPAGLGHQVLQGSGHLVRQGGQGVLCSHGGPQEKLCVGG